MSQDLENPVEVEEYLEAEDTLSVRFMDWLRTDLIWYAGSFTAHLLGLSLLLLMGSVATKVIAVGDETVIQLGQADIEKPEADQLPPEKIDIGETPEKPTRIILDPIAFEKPEVKPLKEKYYDDSKTFEERRGGTLNPSKNPTLGDFSGFKVISYGPGPKFTGPGGVPGSRPGNGGPGDGEGIRNRGYRRARAGRDGATGPSERAVEAALHWLYRHQLSEGNWSLQNYKQRCSDATCTGPGTAHADAGATALGLLTYLAAGQTHKSKGMYRNCVERGLLWLMRHQEPNGNLAKGDQQHMYSHGLATIALCEAYSMSSDRNLGAAAQAAVNYIIAAQNKNDFGWRYEPGMAGDTSVYGWQVMALKSAQLAGLNVGGSLMEGVGKWLDLVKSGPHDCNFSYQANSGATPAMSAVGLLCRQYLGTKREDPMMVDGIKYLLTNLPDERLHNIYYWYYATQVVHNYTGYEWDTWNRAMRKLLIRTQTRQTGSCANGSWDPAAPTADAWGVPGGRHLLTTLSCLTLEIYYRIQPLYKLDAEPTVPIPVKK